MNAHRKAMQRALADMDRIAMTITCRAHKDKARALLNERPVVMTNRGYRIVDRWFRRVAFLAPRDLGKFIHGGCHEEPKRFDGKNCIRTYHQVWYRWNGIPEVKS